jgi:hypothetical protein
VLWNCLKRLKGKRGDEPALLQNLWRLMNDLGA